MRARLTLLDASSATRPRVSLPDAVLGTAGHAWTVVMLASKAAILTDAHVTGVTIGRELLAITVHDSVKVASYVMEVGHGQ